MFDLDDTIVQAGSHVSKRVIESLSRAHSAGYVLSIASGRPLCSVNKDVLLSGVMDYAVCANGATVTRLADGAKVCHRSLTKDDALSCYELLAPYKPAWNVFLDNRALFEWKGASYMLTGRTGAIARTKRYTTNKGSTLRNTIRLARRGMRYVSLSFTNKWHVQVFSILPLLKRAEQGVDKMGCTIPDPAKCAEAARVLARDGRFEVIQMGRTELEITAKGVTKGTGTLTLMEHLGFAAKDAVAFGDGGNDLPLASSVGFFVAMGNADDDVKAQADDVCPAVNEDGVAVWIDEHLLVGLVE